MRVGVPLVELNGFQCCLGSLLQIGRAIAAPTIAADPLRVKAARGASIVPTNDELPL